MMPQASEHNSPSSSQLGVNKLGLTPLEEEKCNQAFKALDKDGSEDIDADELRTVLRMMGIVVNEAKLQRMMTEANPDDPTTINKDQFKRATINKDQFKRVIGKQRKFQNKSNEEDTLDAYVALGG